MANNQTHGGHQEHKDQPQQRQQGDDVRRDRQQQQGSEKHKPAQGNTKAERPVDDEDNDGAGQR